MREPDQYTFSVIIGRASTQDRHRILECLDALRRQQGEHRYEVIVADRHNDEISEEIQRYFPEVSILKCQESMTLPQLRTRALRESRGEIIVVTEDHCVPALDWLSTIAETFTHSPASAIAVGGCVENGLPQSNLDWATFFCEYSNFLGPVGSGDTEVLPGMNIAYKSSAFTNVEEDVLVTGFWETTLHPLLLASGHTFYSNNNIVVLHKKKFSLGFFLKQRFLYSRYYAGMRFGRDQRLVRLAAAGFSVFLPGLVLARMTANIYAKKRLYYEFVRAIPHLLIFVLVWALGELWGYLFGAGDALLAIE